MGRQAQQRWHRGQHREEKGAADDKSPCSVREWGGSAATGPGAAGAQLRPAQASGSHTVCVQPGPVPAGSTHHGAPVRLPQLTGPRRPDCPAQLTDQALLRWRETKARERANPRGPAPAPGTRA
ncbi:uncharacterized protein LOC143266868 [Peromyscus maniculatus bairdii]|uniref:uncharacterized protein LOC143266868 n=1 Tax=Peromyscus maniculatus bairdii TaxID=230844 RepID=UPI003FD01720